MLRKITFLAGAGVGYVLGARAGREQYVKITEFAKKTAESPQVQQAMGMADKAVEKIGGDKLTSMMGDSKDEAPSPAHAGGASNGYASTGSSARGTA